MLQMLEEQRIKDATNIRAFVTAGRAKFTIRSKKTSQHFTYYIRLSPKRMGSVRDKDALFVSVLTGPDVFSYIGMITDEGDFRLTKNSKASADAPSVLAFDWFWRHIDTNALDELDFFHIGECARCGKELTHPVSIERGFGPECLKLMGME